MDILNIVNTIVVVIGVPTIAGVLIYSGRKLQTLDTLEITVNKMKGNIKVISDFLTRSNTEFDLSEIQTYSPFQLTDKGKIFIETLGFDKVFSDNKSYFFSFIDSENPKLKYDVESASIKAIRALSDKEFMNFLKVFFYNNPKRNMENTASTLGVYLRDRYLEEHPEIVE